MQFYISKNKLYNLYNKKVNNGKTKTTDIKKYFCKIKE